MVQSSKGKLGQTEGGVGRGVGVGIFFRGDVYAAKMQPTNHPTNAE